MGINHRHLGCLITNCLYDTIIGVHDITNNQAGQAPGDPNSVERFWYVEAKGFIFEAEELEGRLPVSP